MDESLKKALRKLDEVLGLLAEPIRDERASSEKAKQEIGADNS